MAIVVLIASGKGGSGKSTVSALLGETLAVHGKRTLAIELDSGLRSLDVALGLSKEILFDLGDVMRGSCALPDAIYPSPLCRDFSLISAAAKPVAVPETALCKISDELSDEFEFILLDCPAGIGYALEYAGTAANCALLVATPDPASIRGVRAASEAVYRLGLTAQRLIINRIPPKPRLLSPLLDLDEVIDGAGVQLIGALWEDIETRAALASGVMLSPGSPNLVPFSNIARRLCGERVPLAIK